VPKSLSPIPNRIFGLFAYAVLVAVASNSTAFAQTIQPWPDVIVSVPATRDVLVSGEVIGRIADDQRTSQLETRVQIGHAFSQKVTAWIGWVHFENYNSATLPRGHENQGVEQINWNIGNAGRIHISTRTRLEQRFITGVDTTSWRWRQQLRAAMPLGAKGAPSAIFWIEPFIALNETASQRRTLDQLRSFAGLSMPIARRVDLEIGYLNQRIYRLQSTVVNNAIPMIITVHL
jgi:hypothetical protein